MRSSSRSRGAWIAEFAIAALLIVVGIFKLLPHAKAPVDLVLAGATLAVVGIINLIRAGSRSADAGPDRRP